VLVIDTLEIAVPFTNVVFGAHVRFCFPFTHVLCDRHVTNCVLFISHLPTWGTSNTLGIFIFFIFRFFFSLFF
jgi:hypothetical protein